MSTKNIFTNDKTVTQLFINGKTKKVKESYMLINFHGWTESEVRIMQAARKEING